MDKDYQITVDNLIKDELDGKSNAIAQYDIMLWKIRSGYAVFLYASIGLIIGLVNENVINLSPNTAVSLSILVFGFSAFATFLDYSFMHSKLRVVDYRNRLKTLAYKLATGAELEGEDHNELLECLKNSGERREKIRWERWSGFWRPPFLYGGTCLVCISAAAILAK